MNPKALHNEIQQMDIYLLDQVLKDNIPLSARILDAGCGSGRNSFYFFKNNFNLIGIDSDIPKIKSLQQQFSKDTFLVSSVNKIPFQEAQFDYIICNAVLHFAKNEEELLQMFSELFRVLTPKGTLFIRMTSNIGIENKVKAIKNGVYQIPDGSKRFLLTRKLLNELQEMFSFDFLEPLKTVNVNDLRCMSTLVLQKR